MQIEDFTQKNVTKTLDQLEVIEQFKDGFLVKTLGLLSKRDIDLILKLVPWVKPISK